MIRLGFRRRGRKQLRSCQHRARVQGIDPATWDTWMQCDDCGARSFVEGGDNLRLSKQYNSKAVHYLLQKLLPRRPVPVRSLNAP